MKTKIKNLYATCIVGLKKVIKSQTILLKNKMTKLKILKKSIIKYIVFNIFLLHYKLYNILIGLKTKL